MTERSPDVELVHSVFEAGILVGLLSLLLVLMIILLIILLVFLLMLCRFSLLSGGFTLLQTLFLGSDHVCMMSVAESGADKLN